MNSLAGSFFAVICPRETKQRCHQAFQISSQRSFETLERRDLLTGDLLPSIIGQSFIDLTNDGITADDIPLANAILRLHADNGDGMFDSSDTLLQSTTTDNAGNYRFNKVSPGVYFAEQVDNGRVTKPWHQQVHEIVVTAADTVGALGFPIDNFDKGTKVAFASSNGPRTADVVESISTTFGGQRDMFVELTNGLGALELRANPYGSQLLQYDSTAGVQGNRIVSWDGIDATAAAMNPTGLDHLDLTENGDHTAFVLTIGSDQDDGAVTVRVHSDAHRASEATVLVPNSGGPATLEVLVPFDKFQPVAGKSGADFTDVGAIELAIVGKNSVDGQIALFSVIGPIQIRQDLASLPLTDLELTKSDLSDPVAAGEELVYTLVARNHGPWPASGVTVTDALPPSVSFESATLSKGSIRHEGGTVVAEIGNLDVDETVEITLTVTVDASIDGTVVNMAMMTGNEHDPNLENNNPEEPTKVVPQVDLAIFKSDEPDPTTAGGTIAWIVVVVNNGPSDATGVMVVDTLPTGVTFRSATSSQGVVSANGNQVTARLQNLTAGETATIDILADVDAATIGTLINTAAVSSNEEDVNLQNNFCEEQTVVHSVIDLEINKSDAPDPVTAGEKLAYTLVVTNNGLLDATGVVVTDHLPDGLNFESVISSQGTTSASGSVVTTTLGDLDSGQTATIDILATVLPTARGTLVNVARVNGNETETNLTNNEDEEVTQIRPQVDLSIVKSDSQDPVISGDDLTYILNVTNHGPSAATRVVVRDSLPEEVLFQSVSMSQGSASHSAGHLTANLGNLNVGASATIVIETSIRQSASGTIENRTEVEAQEEETNLTNNSDIETTQVEMLLSSISGTVFLDSGPGDQDGIQDANDPPIPGVTILLTGHNILGKNVKLETKTNSNGDYMFENLVAGTYTLKEEQPTQYHDGKDTLGPVALAQLGDFGQLTVLDDYFSGIVLPAGIDATDNDFAELAAMSFSKRRFVVYGN